MNRKAITVILALTALNLAASESIDLADAPWTDASLCWTCDGRRYPVKNQNLMGNKITIGGVKYDKGIAGHTGFSVVYNLSGKALKFTAMAGIDDEAHPVRDKTRPDITESEADIVILVDRVEVFRKTVKWKDKAIPVSIDLKGASQLELRGKHGKIGFLKQRVVFANPVLKVKNRDDFMKNADNWAKRVQNERNRVPDYPLAPDWKTVKIEKINWKIWKNAYRLDNGVYELIVVPEFGGRIMSFKKKGGENILTENEASFNGEIPPRGKNMLHGGHLTRAQPHNYFHPGDPILSFGRYEIEFPAEGEVLVTSPASWYMFLRYQTRIKLVKDGQSVEIDNRHANLAPFTNKAGIWSITRIKTNLVQTFMIAPEMKNPPLPMAFRPENLKSQIKFVDGWNTLAISKAYVEKMGPRDSIEWKEFATKNEMRVKLTNSVFVKKFELPENEFKNMAEFWPVHLYLCKALSEVECHGPTKELAPLKSISLKESWEIKNIER